LTSGEKAETLERTAPEPLQKITANFYEVAGLVWLELKL